MELMGRLRGLELTRQLLRHILYRLNGREINALIKAMERKEQPQYPEDPKTASEKLFMAGAEHCCM
jgi:hypothetical protein